MAKCMTTANSDTILNKVAGAVPNACTYVFQLAGSSRHSHSAEEQGEAQRGQGHPDGEGQSWLRPHLLTSQPLLLTSARPCQTGYKRLQNPSIAARRQRRRPLDSRCPHGFFFFFSKVCRTCNVLVCLLSSLSAFLPFRRLCVNYLGQREETEFKCQERHSPKCFSKPSFCPGNRLLRL